MKSLAQSFNLDILLKEWQSIASEIFFWAPINLSEMYHWEEISCNSPEEKIQEYLKLTQIPNSTLFPYPHSNPKLSSKKVKQSSQLVGYSSFTHSVTKSKHMA